MIQDITTHCRISEYCSDTPDNETTGVPCLWTVHQEHKPNASICTIDEGDVLEICDE